MSGFIEHDTLDEAYRAAADAAIGGFGRVFPCTVFTQGKRTMLSTSFPFSFVANQVTTKPASKDLPVQDAMNRPLMADHAKAINRYLVENREQYILPPVTLNVRELPSLHVAKDRFAMRIGYMVVDDATQFYVTDGQHRISAIRGLSTGRPAVPSLIEQDPSFKRDGLAVLIVIEPDTEAIHQDFADAAQTKQIPPSLLASYNTRAPINRVLNSIVKGSRLFNGRIDDTSKTLPKMSQSIFLLNQVRGLVKELLVRDYAMAEDTLTRSVASRIGTREQQDAFIEQTHQLLDVLTEHMPPWGDIAKAGPIGGAANRIPEFRTNYINMTATGLVLIGRAGFEINKISDPEERMAMYRRLATEIDWRRNADIWRNNIIIPTDEDERGKIVTLRGAVNRAAAQILLRLGLDGDDRPE